VIVAVRIGDALVGHARLHSSRRRTLVFPVRLGGGSHRIRVTARGTSRRCARAILDAAELVPAAPDESGLTRRGPRRVIGVNAAVHATLGRGVDPALDRTCLERFDGLTPENDMKMAIAEPRRGVFAFAAADHLDDFAARNGKTVRGHALIWHNQLPGWLTRQAWSRADMLGILHDWIGTIVARYKGRIADWDVLNEVFDESGARRRNSPWYNAIGADLAEAALRAAHDADPGAHLFINDYGIERPGPKQDAVVNLVRGMQDKGVPIDGVGLQAHWSIGDLPPEPMLVATLRRFASLGIRVQFTEVDINTDHEPDALMRQAAGYAMIGRACQAVAACDRVTVWGVSDRDSWRGAANRPLMLDDHFLEKPAYAALRGALAAG
jgi:endo-1,4-beta-xylanase